MWESRWIRIRGFPEFRKKYAWCGFSLNVMDKNWSIECSAGASPRDTAIVYVAVNIRVVKTNNDFLFKNGLGLDSIPIFFGILFSMYFICVFQLRFSSNNTPRNFFDSVRAISLLFIFNFGKASGISSFLLGLWKNEYLFFFSH